jgi:DedD protein
MALVVFVPMILDNEPRPSRSQPSLAIPSKENAPPLPAPFPAAAPAPAPAPAAPPRVAQSAPAAPPSASGEVVVPPKPAGTDRQANRSVPLEGFAVQVGAFREEERLKQARAKLEAARIPHYIERVEASGGAITRLRAGPFATREAADAARAKLNEGQVVALP